MKPQLLGVTLLAATMVCVAGCALQLRVTWVEPASTLNLWVDGQLFEGASHGPSEASADVPVSAGEVLVYVGMVTQAAQVYVPLTLTTAMVK